MVSTTIKPNFAILGKRLGKDIKKVSEAISKLSAAQVSDYLKTGSVTIEGYAMGPDDIQVRKQRIRIQIVNSAFLN